MTNSNSLWKVLLLALVLVVGALMALPNLFGSDPAVQVAGRDGALPTTVVDKIRSTLTETGFDDAEVRLEEGRASILFDSEDRQLVYRDALRQQLDPNEAIVTDRKSVV